MIQETPPPALEPIPENIPDELKTGTRYVLWRWALRADKKGKPPKWTKPPYTTEGSNAAVDDASTWTDFPTALATYRNGGGFHGLGRILQAGDGYAGIDLDKCVNPETGAIEPWARAIIRRLNSYTEISPSGTGIRIIVHGSLPPGRRRAGHIEMYDSGRYLTLTGHHVPDTPTTIEERAEELADFHTETFSGDLILRGGRAQTDDELIERAKQAANGAKFRALWAGETAAYGDDSSAADLALCNLLAFWTNGDAGRMDGLFRRSGLMRPKWSERRGELTYGERTITIALQSHTPRTGGGSRASDPERTDTGGDPTFHLTDLGNAERLVRRHGKDIRYCYRWGAWLVWDSKRWRVDENGGIVRRAKETIRALYAEAAALVAKAAETESNGDDLLGSDDPEAAERVKAAKKAQALLTWAKKSEARDKITAMIKLAESEPGIPVSPDELDAHPWLLNVENGTLDLRTGHLRPPVRDDLLTKLTPAAYSPNAACPTWLTFLSRIFDGNAALIEFMRRSLGYSLTGDTSEQVLFVLHGTGQNGKSTLIETIRALLGDGYAQQADFASFLAQDRASDKIRNDLARLFGSRFVSAVEVEAGRRLSEVLIKQLTGGDRITARFLFREFFEFTPAFKLFLACNHKPVIAGTDFAIWRRVRLVPFNVTIPKEEQDKKLPEKLRVELPGILTWLVRGCLDWQKDGLTEPAEVTEATQAYREEMDILGGFLAERCVLGARFKVPASDLYKAYTAYCEASGEEPIKQTTFGLRLSERGITVRRDSTNGKKVRIGIGLLTDGAPPPSQPTLEGEGLNSLNSLNSIPDKALREGGPKESYPQNRSDCSDCSENDPLAEKRAHVRAAAERLGFLEVDVTKGVRAGPGVASWEAWIGQASEGALTTMGMLLETMEKQKGGAP